MARPIVLAYEGAESSFDHTKLDRARLYGARKRIPLDQQGETCMKASLTLDGLYLLQPGMTAQGYFDEQGRWVQRTDLVGLDPDGNAVALKPSTLGVAQAAAAVDPGEILQHAIEAVYVLDPVSLDAALAARLDAGDVFRFDFNYSVAYRESAAFLLKNADGCFCLVGAPTLPVWGEPGKVAVVEAADEAADGDLDFEMF